MFGFLRKLLRRPPPKQSLAEISEALRRREEKLPCCGASRYAHAHYRSGLLRCPTKLTPEEYIERLRKHKYNPLAEDTCYYPPGSEKHFKCDDCGCARGVHELLETEIGRGRCTDPDCPGCKGCSPP